MEIDVTHMVEESDAMFELSGSVMEHGKDAGKYTFNNSIEYGTLNTQFATTLKRSKLSIENGRREAQRYCREWNAAHNPGPLSRKAEFDQQ